MKTLHTNLRSLSVFFICLLGIVLTILPGYAKNQFKLKDGAKGKICLKCHEDFKKTLNKSHLHPLLRAGECSGCHDPHTSYHKDLLTAETTRLCSSCHKEVLPEKARSAHKVVVEGNCGRCHDSHGSDNAFQLKELGNELCFGCHEDMERQVNKNRFKHRPLSEKGGCLTCHDPHASDKFDFQLKKDAPSLCTNCHDTSKTSFNREHMDYPIANTDCTSCHNPHGSNTRGMLFDNAHIPLVKKKCGECHVGPSSPKAFATKKQGIELCEQCHEKMIRRTFDNNRLHWPIVDKVGCLNCHSPHGTKEKKLLKGPIVKVCGTCHSDTVVLQKWSIDNPKNPKLCEPVKKGNCIACHSPHASDYVLLLPEESISIGLCGRCHEWQTHSTHPIGEKAIDQRNRNLTVECVSCHKACGTGNKPSMMPFGTVYELCIQCHVERKR